MPTFGFLEVSRTSRIPEAPLRFEVNGRFSVPAREDLEQLRDYITETLEETTPPTFSGLEAGQKFFFSRFRSIPFIKTTDNMGVSLETGASFSPEVFSDRYAITLIKE